MGCFDHTCGDYRTQWQIASVDVGPEFPSFAKRLLEMELHFAVTAEDDVDTFIRLLRVLAGAGVSIEATVLERIGGITRMHSSERALVVEQWSAVTEAEAALLTQAVLELAHMRHTMTTLHTQKEG